MWSRVCKITLNLLVEPQHHSLIFCPTLVVGNNALHLRLLGADLLSNAEIVPHKTMCFIEVGTRRKIWAIWAQSEIWYVILLTLWMDRKHWCFSRLKEFKQKWYFSTGVELLRINQGKSYSGTRFLYWIYLGLVSVNEF